MRISESHPRYQSLTLRERLAKAVTDGIVSTQGLIAHGRGEAFDYILGEKTTRPASRATSVAAALLLTANRPVVSVNGNVAALVGREIVKLASLTSARIEVNLFHRTVARENRIAHRLELLGAKQILGVGKTARLNIPGISSSRKRADPEGIGSADVTLIPLEDGDRAEMLEKSGKKVIAIDLNPLSRTSRVASVSIVDNIVRALPALNKAVTRMKKKPKGRLKAMAETFDNRENLARTVQEMVRYLRTWK